MLSMLASSCEVELRAAHHMWRMEAAARVWRLHGDLKLRLRRDHHLFSPTITTLISNMGQPSIPPLASLEQPEKLNNLLAQDKAVADDCTPCRVIGPSIPQYFVSTGQFRHVC